ncbi:hypothetical protein LG293_17985 (plasmid) [Citricoccus nitrophenolicus]
MPARNRKEASAIERTAMMAATAARRSAVNQIVPLRASGLGLSVHPAVQVR